MRQEIIKARVNPETIKGLDDEQLEALVYEKASQLDGGTLGERFTSRLLPFALQGLKKIGAAAHADLLARAATIYEEHGGREAEKDDEGDDTGREFGEDDDDSGRIHELHPLEDEHYALEETYSLRVRFVRANIEKYFD